jgi:Spy/CpxP family protein refolding chaperone
MYFSQIGHATSTTGPSNKHKETSHMTITRPVTLTAVAAVFALALAAGTGVIAQNQNTSQDQRSFNGPRMGRGGPMGPGGPMGMFGLFGPDLNLTDAQKQQIKSIADSHKAEWQAFAERARAAHQALQGAMAADTVDDGLIRAKSAEVAAVEADMAVASAHARAEVWPILTAEQQAKVKERQNAPHGRGRGRGPRL